jgi:CelD/BcsL family acetyltransferase involved in cellulose biosynthesis
MSGASLRNRSDVYSISISVESHYDFACEEYTTLFSTSEATAFQHPIWLNSFYAELVAKRNAKPVFITGRSGPEGQLVFLLPMISRRLGGITLLEATDLGVSDYAVPVVDQAWLAAEAGNASAIAQQVSFAIPRHDLLHIRNIREEHIELWRLFFDQPVQQHDFSAHALDLTTAGKDWRNQMLADDFRKRFERKRRKFANSNEARIRVLDDPAEAAAGINKLAELRHGRFEGDMIAYDFVRDFYAGVAAKGCASGYAATYVFEVGDEMVGVAFAIAHAGRLNYLLIGCDYMRHGSLSPGMMIYDRMIDDWADKGGAQYDFTIGDEPFKFDFGTKPTLMWEMVNTATLQGRAFMGLRKLRNRVRERLARVKGNDKD